MQTQEGLSIKNYVDREGLEANGHHSILFIYCASHAIKTIVASPKQERIFALRELEDHRENLFEKDSSALKQLFDSLGVYRHEFTGIKVIISNSSCSMVPEALFAGEKAASFLKLSTSAEKQQVLFNRLQRNRVSVFSVSENFYQALKTLLPQADVHHQAEWLITSLVTLNHKENKEQLYVEVRDHSIGIVHLKNNDLHYLNTFQTEADTDVVYYVLSVVELLKLNQDKLEVTLFGNINSNGSLMGLLKKYVAHVELSKRPEQFSYPASFREFPDHQHYLEICSLLCAS